MLIFVYNSYYWRQTWEKPKSPTKSNCYRKSIGYKFDKCYKIHLLWTMMIIIHLSWKDIFVLVAHRNVNNGRKYNWNDDEWRKKNLTISAYISHMLHRNSWKRHVFFFPFHFSSFSHLTLNTSKFDMKINSGIYINKRKLPNYNKTCHILCLST